MGISKALAACCRLICTITFLRRQVVFTTLKMARIFSPVIQSVCIPSILNRFQFGLPDAESPAHVQSPLEVISVHTAKSDLVVGSTVSVLVLLFALAWGSPFIGFTAARAQDQPQPQQTQQAKSGTFTGTVVKSGDQYVLRDSSGETFKLDDAQRAQPFEGKTVKVTGQLDEQARTIHVENIVSAEG